MRLTLFFIIISFPILKTTVSYSQNIVPNYSFENVTPSYPYSENGYNCSGGAAGSYEDWIIPYWAEIIEWTHPLRREVCLGLSAPSVGTADVRTYDPGSNIEGSFSTARSGVRFGYGDATEYHVVPLNTSNNTTGKKYYFECFNSETFKNIWLSNLQPKQCKGWGNNSLVGNGRIYQKIGTTNPNAQVEESNSRWRRTRFYFNANIDADWLSVGNSGDNNDGQEGGDIDDVRIIEVNENYCANDTWYFDNTVFNYPHEMFQASNEIILGNGVDPEASHIPGDVTVLSNSETILRAGNRVVMEPGFSTQLGCYFETIIEPCQPNLCPDPPELEDEYISCLGESIELTPTSGDTWGGNFSWTPTTYLSNTDQINPTFTPPSGSGSIEYTLHYSVACASGEVNFDTQTIEVFYTDHLDPPSIDGVVLEEKDLEIDFELTVNSATQHVDVQVIDLSDNSTYYDITLERGVDFNSNVFTVPANGFVLCNDYKFIFKVENKCIGVSDSYEYIWDKNNNPTPTLVDFTPFGSNPAEVTLMYGGDGVSSPPGEFCIETSGADILEYEVIERLGTTIKDGTVILQNNTYCLWDVTLNNGNPAPDAVYQIVVELYNTCNSNSYDQLIGPVQVESYSSLATNNYLGATQNQVSSSVLPNDTEERSSSVSNPDPATPISVYPNPSKGAFTIKGIALVDHYTVTDVSGKIVLRSTPKNQPVIHIESYASGIYFLQYQLKDGTVGTEKLVLNP